jgi:MoaA/NifB/PqqE/SkfB family radical SAM enzyme
MTASADHQRLIDAVRALRPEERRRRNLDLLDTAPLIDLEMASACNVVCAFCPRDDMVRSAGLMSEDTFTAVENFLPGNAVIMISGLGDAVLHPQLANRVRRLNDKGHSCCVITNGVRLTPERQRDLIDAGIAQIQVSVHGVDRETVARVMPRGSDPERVRANLDHLAKTRPPHLRVRINFVETGRNGHARLDVERYARDRDFEFFYRREHTRGGSLGAGRQSQTSEGCGIFAAVTFISSDGDVLPCVNDVRGEGRLGNVRSLNWAHVEAWKRRVIDEGRWFAACADCDDDYRWVLIAQGELDSKP